MIVDHSWLLSSEIIPADIPLIIVLNPHRRGQTGPEEVEASAAFLGKTWIRCCPAMDGGPGIMHAKFMLVSYMIS